MNDIPKDRKGVAPETKQIIAIRRQQRRKDDGPSANKVARISRGSTCVDVASITEAKYSISPTNTSMVHQSQGKEAAAESQGI